MKTIKKIYSYHYIIVNYWDEIIEEGDNKIFAENMSEALDKAFSDIRTKYLRYYDEAILIDITKIELIETVV